MNYAEIKNFDIANGTGCRVSLFVSGCRIHCPNCFNKCAQDFSYGKEFTKETEDYMISLLKNEHISGLTILGGEPFEPENQKGLVGFVQRVKKEVPGKTIWVYSGYLYEDIKDGKITTQYTKDILDCVDVLVDGPYVESLKDLSFEPRGSSNQRILKIEGCE